MIIHVVTIRPLLKIKAIWLPIYCIIRYFRHSVSGSTKIAQLTKCSLNTAYWKTPSLRFRYNMSYQRGSATSDNCVVYDYYEIAIIINLLYISYNARVPYPTMQHFVTEHDEVIKWKRFPHYWPFVSGEFPVQRPVMWSFDVFFDLPLNKRLSKQSWGWWFETPSRPLWRYRNECADVCTFLLQNDALWDICVMNCGICEMGLL